jgi:secondary thiamine-phosphate synthase enzyme
MKVVAITTHAQTELIDITSKIDDVIQSEGMREGLCFLYVPHTTAAITINESADPHVRADILMILNQIVPWEAGYRHREGNSPAHVKASLLGASQVVGVENGRMLLGTWQGIFFCEFDGPRKRKLHITLMPKKASHG